MGQGSNAAESKLRTGEKGGGEKGGAGCLRWGYGEEGRGGSGASNRPALMSL